MSREILVVMLLEWAGYIVLLTFSWKVALGVFLILWSHRVAEIFRSPDYLMRKFYRTVGWDKMMGKKK